MRVLRSLSATIVMLGGALLATTMPSVANDEVALAAEDISFVDVPTSHVFYEQIQLLARDGISTGYIEPNGSRTFRPSAPVLREQMAAFLYRIAFFNSPNPEAPPAVSPFADVSTSHTFYKEIVWLYESGITTGYIENGVVTFRPSQPVLREQMAAFICRAGTGLACADLETETEGGAVPGQFFADVPPGAPFFDAIWFMGITEISTGYVEPNGSRTYRPSQPVLREQMAAFLVRAFASSSSDTAFTKPGPEGIFLP